MAPRRFAMRAEKGGAEEVLRELEESGLFTGDERLLQQLRELAKQGVHPMEALRALPPEEER